MLTTKNKFTGKIKITNDLVLKVYLDELKFNIDKIIDSAIGEIWQPAIVKLLIDLFMGTIKNAINIFFIKGWSIKWLLDIIGLGFVTLETSDLQPFDGYFIFFFTPKFTIDDETISNIGSKIDSFLPRAVEVRKEQLEEWTDAVSEIANSEEEKSIIKEAAQILTML